MAANMYQSYMSLSLNTFAASSWPIRLYVHLSPHLLSVVNWHSGAAGPVHSGRRCLPRRLPISSRLANCHCDSTARDAPEPSTR